MRESELAGSDDAEQTILLSSSFHIPLRDVMAKGATFNESLRISILYSDRPAFQKWVWPTFAAYCLANPTPDPRLATVAFPVLE